MAKAKPHPSGAWERKLARAIGIRALRDGVAPAYVRANSNLVNTLLHASAASSTTSPNAMGGKMTVNMSSTHIAAFCTIGYQNCYDRGTTSKKRAEVDNALPYPAGGSPSKAYFGALELTGTGIRYYGDICLVLKRDVIAHDTLILERNSYDLFRSPFVEQVRRAGDPVSKRAEIARSWSGSWQKHLGSLAAVRLVSRMQCGDRSWTLGQIAQALCDDEDYIEVIKQNSFIARDLLEARTSAADVALELSIRDRLARGPVPTVEALVWSTQRRAAQYALERAGVPLRVVTTAGRARG